MSNITCYVDHYTQNYTLCEETKEISFIWNSIYHWMCLNVIPFVWNNGLCIFNVLTVKERPTQMVKMWCRRKMATYCVKCYVHSDNKNRCRLTSTMGWWWWSWSWSWCQNLLLICWHISGTLCYWITSVLWHTLSIWVIYWGVLWTCANNFCDGLGLWVGQWELNDLEYLCQWSDELWAGQLELNELE